MKILLDTRVTVTFLRAFQPSAGLSHWKIGTRQTCMEWLLIIRHVNSVNYVNSANCVNLVNSVNSVNSCSAVLPPSPMVFFNLYLYSLSYSYLCDWDSDGVEQDVFFAPTRGSKPIYHLYLALPRNVLAIQETWRGGGVLLLFCYLTGLLMGRGKPFPLWIWGKTWRKSQCGGRVK